MREDGKFAVVQEHDHHMDALRYAVMARPWEGGIELPKQKLPWGPDKDVAFPPSATVPAAKARKRRFVGTV